MVNPTIILGLLWLPLALTQVAEVSQETSFVKVNEVIKNFLSQINDLMDTDNKEKAEEIINRLNAANLTLTPQQRQSINQRTKGKLWVPPFHRSYIQRRNVSSITASINEGNEVSREGSAAPRIQARQPLRREEIPDVFEKITEILKPKSIDATVSPLTVHRPPVATQQRRYAPNTPGKSFRRPANFNVPKGKTQKVQVKKQSRQPMRRTQFRNAKNNLKSTEKIHKPFNPIPQVQNRQVRPDEPVPRPAVNQQKMQLTVRDHMVVLMPTTDEPTNSEPKSQKPVNETLPTEHRQTVPRQREVQPSAKNRDPQTETPNTSEPLKNEDSSSISQQNRNTVPENVHEQHPEERRPKFDRVVPYNPQAMQEAKPQSQQHRQIQRRVFRQRQGQEVQERNQPTNRPVQEAREPNQRPTQETRVSSQQRRQETSLEQSLNTEIFEIFKKYNVTGFVLKSGEFSVKAFADPRRTQFIPASLNLNDIDAENSKRRRKFHEFEDDDLNVKLTEALRNKTQSSSSRDSGPFEQRQATPTRTGLERPRHFPIGKKEQIKDQFGRAQRDPRQNYRRNKRKNGEWKQIQEREGRQHTLAESFQKKEQFKELW